MSWCYSLPTPACVLEGNRAAAGLLAELVHQDYPHAIPEQLRGVNAVVPTADIGIWIDPIGKLGSNWAIFAYLPGPKLMTDTQHSTRHIFEWGILCMECESFHTEDSPFKYIELRLEF